MSNRRAIDALREIVSNGRPWIVGYQPGESALGREGWLLFVPANGPVGVEPIRVPTTRPVCDWSDDELASLIHDEHM